MRRREKKEWLTVDETLDVLHWMMPKRMMLKLNESVEVPAVKSSSASVVVVAAPAEHGVEHGIGDVEHDVVD
jgi:hypothetical protein